MAEYEHLKVSDGAGDAALMHITQIRLTGATTIEVDTVANAPDKFIGTYGTLGSNGLITPATKVDFTGHLDGADIVIDDFMPGNVDAGNTVGQVVIIKPNTVWNDTVGGFVENAKGFGTPEDVEFDEVTADAVAAVTVATTGDITEKGNTLTQMRKDTIRDMVVSGGIWTGDAYASTRNASMTALVCYINGQRGTVSAVTARAFTASKDTYIDVLNTAGVFTLVYTEVANNAASPALAANSLRLGIVVTGASNIAAATSINQGQPSRTLPTTTNVGKAGIDSLGNKIRNTDPNGVLRFSAWASLLTSGDLVSLTLPLLEDYTYEIEASVSSLWQGAPAVQSNLKINVNGTDVVTSRTDVYTNNENVDQTIFWQGELTAGSRVVKLNLSTTSGGYNFTTASWKLTAYPVRT